ncbi:MAG: DNA polymerase [Candidatus Bathyarchaeia archaeon]
MKIVGLDTETILKQVKVKDKWAFEHTFYSAQLFSEDLGLREIVYEPEQLALMFTHKTRDAVFLAQRAEYDVAVLSKILPQYGFNISVNYNKSSFVKAVIYKGMRERERSNPKTGKTQKWLEPAKVWRIYDLAQLFRWLSLSEVGKMIGCEKYPRPAFLGKRGWRTDQEREEFERYALRDAEICYRAGKWLLQKFGTLRATLPGLSCYVFKKHYKGGYLRTKWSDVVEEKIKQAYRGGRVEAWWRGTVADKLYYYDVNSLYPYVMANYNYPFISGELDHKSTINLCREGVARVKVKQDADIPILGLKMKLNGYGEKFVFPNGTLTGWWTYPELRLLEREGLGKIIKVYEAFECDGGGRPFRGFVEDFYRLRQTDKQYSLFYKLFLNALYGKFGQNPRSDVRLITKSGVEKRKGEQKRRPYRNYLLASYITAYARCHMWRIFKKLGAERIVYTDTDSVITTKRLSDVGSEMGQLKLEDVLDGGQLATFVRAKAYIWKEKVVWKGLIGGLTGIQARELIRTGKFEAWGQALLRIKAAWVRKTPFLCELPMLKTFSLGEDGKRAYEEHLVGKELLETATTSQPIEV